MNSYWSTLVQPILGRDAHRPLDREAMRAAARELSASGLTPHDIAGALRLSDAAVRDLLGEEVCRA